MRLFVLLIFSFTGICSPFIAPKFKIVEPDRTVFNDENVKYWIEYYDIKFSAIVYRQYIIESAHGTSNICKENHNLFGMKLPWKRKTVAIGKNRNHAVYSSFIQSIEDYKLYQKYNEKNIEFDYYSFLKKYKYSANKDYTKQLRRIKI
jgi:uncharacterized FlgJ-related protein